MQCFRNNKKKKKKKKEKKVLLKGWDTRTETTKVDLK